MRGSGTIILAVFAVLAVVSCKKPDKEPVAAVQQPRSCQVSRISGQGLSLFEATFDAQGRYEAVNQLLMWNEGTFVFTWDEADRLRDVRFGAAPDYDLLRYVYKDGRIDRAVLENYNTLAKYGEYRYFWDWKVRLGTINWHDYRNRNKSRKITFEYADTSHNFTTMRIADPGPFGQWGEARSFELTYDNKKNPSQQLALVFPFSLLEDAFITPTPNNPTYIVRYDKHGNPEGTQQFSYTYNSDNYPATSTQNILEHDIQFTWHYHCR